VSSNLESVALALAGVALILAITTMALYLRLKRQYGILQGSGDEADFVTVVNRHVTDVASLRGEVATLDENLRQARTDLDDAIRHVAVIRYDAFGDLGGRMSFSAALLDDAGDGLVVTSINGRSESRVYAKGIKAGGSAAGQLSPEEEQAITAARSARTRA
jgi:hypothetical protein